MLTLRQAIIHHRLYDFISHRGERWLIQGETGTGKTTLFNTLAGFLPLKAGQILWNDISLVSLAPDKRPISYLLQDCPVFPHLTVKQQVRLMSDPDTEQRVERYLKAEKDIKGASLSGGEKKVLGLIRVMGEHRPLLILDEPFVGMDPALKRAMIKELRAHQTHTNCLILFTSHDPQDALSFATHQF